MKAELTKNIPTHYIITSNLQFSVFNEFKKYGSNQQIRSSLRGKFQAIKFLKLFLNQILPIPLSLRKCPGFVYFKNFYHKEEALLQNLAIECNFIFKGLILPVDYYYYYCSEIRMSYTIINGTNQLGSQQDNQVDFIDFSVCEYVPCCQSESFNKSLKKFPSGMIGPVRDQFKNVKRVEWRIVPKSK